MYSLIADYKKKNGMKGGMKGGDNQVSAGRTRGRVNRPADERSRSNSNWIPLSDCRLFETHPECKDVFFLFRDVEDLEGLRSSRELRAHGLRSVKPPGRRHDWTGVQMGGLLHCLVWGNIPFPFSQNESDYHLTSLQFHSTLFVNQPRLQEANMSLCSMSQERQSLTPRRPHSLRQALRPRSEETGSWIGGPQRTGLTDASADVLQSAFRPPSAS